MLSKATSFSFILLTLFALSIFPQESQAKVTNKTVKFIAYYEGFTPIVKNDPAGHASIGYGHLIHLGKTTKKDRRKWGKITRRQGGKLLKKDLAATDKAVRRRIHVKINRPILTALTSYAFNLGPGYLDRVNGAKTPVTWVAKRINKGHYKVAAKEMRNYDGAYIGKKRVIFKGLTKRRTREYRLMIRGIKMLR